MTGGRTDAGRHSLEAWAFVRQMLDEMTAMVITEAETELELLDPGDGEGTAATWLDTGGRRRGFLTLRWLDHPDPPVVTTTVLTAQEVTPV